MNTFRFRRGLLAVAMTSLLGTAAVQAGPMLTFEKQWTYDSGVGETGAEIVAIDTASGRAFINNFNDLRIDVVQLSTGALVGSFDVSASGAPNSVAVKNGVVAIAVEAATKTDNGSILFFDAAHDFSAVPAPVANATVAVGALPDMVAFTPDGSKVLVANEGEPNSYNQADSVDPVGSVSIIDVATKSVATVGFGSAVLPADVRVFGPNATQAQDIEPEYISVSSDGSTAFVTLQENNAVAVIDIASSTLTRVDALGFKDHSLAGNRLDASDRDGPGNDPLDGNLQNWPVYGMYMPDAIASYTVGGNTYYVTANEGDARDYTGFAEEERVKDLVLDPTAFPSAASLQNDDNIGRLNVTSTLGDDGNDGDYEALYAFGARSFSIWDAATGAQVYDSGELIEKIIAEQFPGQWDDGRSDNKGPEPEAITLAEINGWFYALVGLERTSGIMVFDVTDPNNPVYQDYILNGEDVSPEGIAFALLEQYSRGGAGYVAVANEVSGTTTLYRVSAVPVPASIALLGIGLVAMRRRFV